MIPKAPFVTSGIRIGSPAMTTRGFGEAEFEYIAVLIDKVIQSPANEETHGKVTGEVKAFMRSIPAI